VNAAVREDQDAAFLKTNPHAVAWTRPAAHDEFNGVAAGSRLVFVAPFIGALYMEVLPLAPCGLEWTALSGPDAQLVLPVARAALPGQTIEQAKERFLDLCFRQCPVKGSA